MIQLRFLHNITDTQSAQSALQVTLPACLLITKDILACQLLLVTLSFSRNSATVRKISGHAFFLCPHVTERFSIQISGPSDILPINLVES